MLWVIAALNLGNETGTKCCLYHPWSKKKSIKVLVKGHCEWWCIMYEWNCQWCRKLFEKESLKAGSKELIMRLL